MKYFVIILCLVLTGCAKPEVITLINALATPNARHLKTFQILSGSSDVSDTNLQFIEYSQHLKKALYSQGYIEAKTPEDITIAIFLEYKIGNPKTTTYTYEQPIYGEVPTGETTTSYSNTHGSVWGDNVSANTNTTSYTTIDTELKIIGSKTKTGTFTHYTRSVVIRALNVTKPSKNYVWTLKMVSSGPSADMRLVVPTMIFAAAPYFGTSSGKFIEVKSDVFEPLSK